MQEREILEERGSQNLLIQQTKKPGGQKQEGEAVETAR